MTTQLLVIDDSATVRKLVEIAFRGADYRIAFAGSGADGLERAMNVPPDVILLDFMLPDMKGLDVCARLAEHRETAQVGVVVMSGKPEVAERVRDCANVVTFLAKPFSAEKVRARIEIALRHGNQTSSRSNTTRIRTFGLDDEPIAEPLQLASDEALALRGDLAEVALYDVLRLLTSSSSSRTGVVRLTTGEHIYVANGSIVLCATTRPTAQLDELAIGHGAAELDEALKAARLSQQQTAKPAVVTLAERGFEMELDVAAALKSHGYRLLTAALQGRTGQFAWQEQRIPAYVEAFGRPMSLTAAALEQARGEHHPAPATAELLDHVYQRALHIAGAIAGLRLSPIERAVLTAVDGTSPLGQLVERIQLPASVVATTIGNLAAAELVMRAEPLTAALHAGPTVVVHDLDAPFVGQLRALLARRLGVLSVIEVPLVAELDAAIGHARPRLILIGSDSHALPPELRALARLSSAALVAVLEISETRTTAETLALGYDAILFKPVHITELERLLAL
jgi:CheY-like chemotaxis protein